MSDVTLHGFAPSVYTRVVKLVLAEKSIHYAFREINPFDETRSQDLVEINSFRRVPVLDHAGFLLYETCAITRYLDSAFPTPQLSPTQAKPLARMAQVMAIVDAHGYWPMVRQVFAHRVFRVAEGLEAEESTVAQGLAASADILNALNEIAGEGLVLNTTTATLADCHLAPMIAAFAAAPEGRDALAQHGALQSWWTWWAARTTMQATDTGFDHLSTAGA